MGTIPFLVLLTPTTSSYVLIRWHDQFNILALLSVNLRALVYNYPRAVSRNGRQPLCPSTPLAHTLRKVLDYSVLTAMPALRHLDVSHNLLCRMEPMDGRSLPSGLETLNMSHNRVSRIGGIGQCFSLRMVDLSHNRIKVCHG